MKCVMYFVKNQMSIVVLRMKRKDLNIMAKLSLKKKLLLSFGALVVIMLVVGAYAISALRDVNGKTANITTAWLPSITANNKMLDAAASYRMSLFRHVLATPPDLMQKYESDIKNANTLMQKGIQEYNYLIDTAVYSSEDARKKDREDLKNLEAAWGKAYQAGAKTIALSRAMKTREASADMKAHVEPGLAALENEMIRPLLAFNEEGAARVSKESEQMYNRAFWVLIILMGAAAAVGVAIMASTIKNIMGSIAELLKVFSIAAKGDLRERGVPQSEDELGRLIGEYNTLVEGTSGLIKQIQSTAEKVASASEELTSSAEQSAQVTQQIAMSITQVAEMSSKEVQAAGEATSAIENISAGIEEGSANVHIAADSTKKTVERAQEGREIIESAVAKMDHIEKTVNHSADVVGKLGERSKEIGQIVETISGIAGQTNLLALNAAIEAARAGEQGKGFAVVAEEVRKLAEQSQEAAKQIRELISGIQADTDEAVIAMNEGTLEVKGGAEAVQKAGTAFGEILEMVLEVSKKADEVADTMEEIANGSQRVVGSVKDIDASSKKASAEVETVSAATQQQSAAMQQMASSSRGLSDLAQALREASNKFKV